MIQEPIQPGLPTPDEASARQRCLHEGVNAPDLATGKDFLHFHAATSRGKIDEEERLTANSLNAFAEWFFAGVTRITGTPTDEGDRSEVYNVGTLPRGYWELNLTIASGSGKRWQQRAWW
jgi:hypothetical protein